VWIFSLEYISQIINSYGIHFVAFKKKQKLRIKGAFICNSRVAGAMADKILKEMKFNTSFPWHYDPCGIIAETRLRNKNSPYDHVPKPEIKKFMNQTEWEVNTLEYSKQYPPSASVSQTITPQVPAEKRTRKDVSSLVTEMSA
jgi:hypothetical protein